MIACLCIQINFKGMVSMIIAGVDEAGRGPLAGPVVAAAVILNSAIIGVMDSKKLSFNTRARLAKDIEAQALDYAYGICSVEEIDALNIHNATLLAMKRAIEGLRIEPEKVLIDGLYCPDTKFKSQAIVKGDALESCISAASILAKVKRDNTMILLEDKYPSYGFATHKGYPTAAHLQALKTVGPCDEHRKSYRPVRQAQQLHQN